MEKVGGNRRGIEVRMSEGQGKVTWNGIEEWLKKTAQVGKGFE